MERYFDAFLYVANWGTRILKLRLPARVIDQRDMRAYLDGAGSTVHRKGDYFVLTFESEGDVDEDSYDLGPAGLLSSMISLRTDLARGDQRALYIAWLACIACGDIDDDAVEPPVPAGLGELNGSLQALADFLRVDPDLIEVAAQASAALPESTLQRDVVEAWVAALGAAEKDEFLTRLLLATEDAAAVAAELQNRLCTACHDSRPTGSRSHEPRRTVGALLRAAEQRSAQHTQAAERAAAEEKLLRAREIAAARVRHLDRLVDAEPRLWADVERFVATKVPKSYDLAVAHLVDLRDLAARKERGGSTDFAARLERFRATHLRKPSLLARLERAGLWFRPGRSETKHARNASRWSFETRRHD